MQCLALWERGTTIRQMCRQKLYSFLNWAVQRGHLKLIYSPPATLPETVKQKRIGYPLSDAQILQILNNLPQGEKHNRWRFAIQLCAVYDLRLEELRYLRIKDGANGAELWTIYQKSMGGERREPKRNRAGCTPCWCAMQMGLPSTGTRKADCRWARNCRR